MTAAAWPGEGAPAVCPAAAAPAAAAATDGELAEAPPSLIRIFLNPLAELPPTVPVDMVGTAADAARLLLGAAAAEPDPEAAAAPAATAPAAAAPPSLSLSFLPPLPPPAVVPVMLDIVCQHVARSCASCRTAGPISVRLWLCVEPSYYAKQRDGAAQRELGAAAVWDAQCQLLSS